MKKLTSDEMEVLMHIPDGKKNAISRGALAASAGYSDRNIRRIISQLREKGYIIINLSGGGGYFITSDPDEIEEYYWQEKSRAMSIFKSLKPFRAELRKAGRAV